MKEFDVWELPQCCKTCGWFDRGSSKDPITYLDGDTKLCEDCFDDKYDKEDEEDQINNIPGCHRDNPCSACDDCLMFSR